MVDHDRETVEQINRLLRICRASEKGFSIAAENVKNRGLKVLFKSYAEQRRGYAAELRQLLDELGGEAVEGSGILPGLHRGWINIKAAVTIGQPATERVVLSEVSRGERTALTTYLQALEAPLPSPVAAVVEEQRAGVEAAWVRVQELRGRDGARLVLRLFDSQEDAEAAVAQLANRGFARSSMQLLPFDEVATVYRGQDRIHTTRESTAAGALVGALLGLLLGVVAALSVLITAGAVSDPLSLLPPVLLSGLLAGLLFGAIIGAIIGAGISQQDRHGYQDSLSHGRIFLLLRAETDRADEAATIMKQVNAGRWRTPLVAQE